ncbi:MAG: tetratricopeptide repeat protein [Flavobacteriales bacterium]
MNCYTNPSKWTFAGLFASLLFLAGCAGLGSMEKEIEAMGLEASPEPLILRGDQVELEVTGRFPAKYFGKKVSIEATPVLTWEGGSASFDSEGFQGEDAAGNFTVVPFEAGKSFSYASSVPFDPAMEDAAELAVVISGSQGNKSATFEPFVVGAGVITTPLWVQSDDQFIPVEDDFQRVISYTEEVTVNYSVNSSSVRSSELRDADWNALKDLIQLSVDADSVTITGARIEAYASPEGEITLNEDLASDRANSAAASVTREMKRKKLSADEAFYDLVPKGEDWQGFKSLMQASDIEDKNLILRVLEMYSDKNKREEEIRNIAKTYKEIEKEILPALRRSQVVVSYDVEGYTDEELMEYCMSMPDALTADELLYAATLYQDLNDKLTIYQSAARVHADDFRGYNNAGWCLAQMGRMNQAWEVFQQALELERNKAVLNNVAALTRQDGDIDGAMKLLNEAAGAGPEVGYNKGIILIQKGDYASAISNMGRMSTVNVALAKMLNGDAAGAKTVLENANDDSAVASYAMAIACARLNDSAGVKKHLGEALAKDPNLRTKAEKDLEFRNMRDAIGL